MGGGVYDMNGNVWEWVEDCWNENYKGAPTNGQAWLSGTCERRVLRGGCWYTYPHHMRSANRNRDLPEEHKYYAPGFRLAQD